MDKVIVHFNSPQNLGGAGTNRQTTMTRVFSEAEHGHEYKELAASFVKGNHGKVKSVDGLDEVQEKEVSVVRKKAK